MAGFPHSVAGVAPASRTRGWRRRGSLVAVLTLVGASMVFAPSANASHPEVSLPGSDFEIDTDPYPIWKRLREERPLYYNERYDFYALSRFDDVERALVDWRTYSSEKGTVLELIKSGVEIPRGSIIFEDPPDHDLYRGLLSRVFTPRKMGAIEPKVREFCARCLDPLVGTGGFDFIRDLGAQMPTRTIGMLLGIPEQDQDALRDRIDEGLRLEDGTMPDVDLENRGYNQSEAFAQYIDWRAEHPSDDLMTELLQAEFEDAEGTRRRLTRDELLQKIWGRRLTRRDRTVDVFIRKLREKIDHRAPRHKFVHTRYGVGYKLEAQEKVLASPHLGKNG